MTAIAELVAHRLPPISFTGRDGSRMFAFYPLHDNPTNVLVELAWAWPGGQKLCDMRSCPATDGGYCLECHMVAAEARDHAARNLGEVAA